MINYNLSNEELWTLRQALTKYAQKNAETWAGSLPIPENEEKRTKAYNEYNNAVALAEKIDGMITDINQSTEKVQYSVVRSSK